MTRTREKLGLWIVGVLIIGLCFLVLWYYMGIALASVAIVMTWPVSKAIERSKEVRIKRFVLVVVELCAWCAVGWGVYELILWAMDK